MAGQGHSLPSPPDIASFQLCHQCTHKFFTAWYIFQVQRESMELARLRHGNSVCGPGFDGQGFQKYENVNGMYPPSLQNFLVMSGPIPAYLEFWPAWYLCKELERSDEGSLAEQRLWIMGAAGVASAGWRLDLPFLLEIASFQLCCQCTHKFFTDWFTSLSRAE